MGLLVKDRGMIKTVTGDRYEGIFGLGLKSQSLLNASFPFDQLVQQKLIPKPLFSIYMGDEEGGEINIGGIDDSKYAVGALHWDQSNGHLYEIY